MGAGGWPHPLGLQHPEGVDPPPGAPPARRWAQVQSLEEGPLEDALEVEEKAYPPPAAQASQDASALQVGSLRLGRAAANPWPLAALSLIYKLSASPVALVWW